VQFYANALRNALSKANSRRQEMLSSLTLVDWRALVLREVQADQWYADSQADNVPDDPREEQLPVPLSLSMRRNGHGVHIEPEAV
jgi:hypothetical protein